VDRYRAFWDLPGFSIRCEQGSPEEVDFHGASPHLMKKHIFSFRLKPAWWFLVLFERRSSYYFCINPHMACCTYLLISISKNSIFMRCKKQGATKWKKSQK
jgi:hypothetical protein